MTPRQPPRLPLALLERFVPDCEPLAGDLMEEFRARPSSSWLWWQVLSAIAGSLRGQHDDIRPLRLVDLQPVDAVERTRAFDLRFPEINMAASPLKASGGLGFVALAATVSKIVPAMWTAVLATMVAGIFLGIALIAVCHLKPARRPARSHESRALLIGLLTAGLLTTSSAAQPRSDRTPLMSVDAIAGVLDAFRSHDVVGLSAGADHGDPRGTAFVVSVIRDARFRGTAIDLVVENVNARYQEVGSIHERRGCSVQRASPRVGRHDAAARHRD